MLQGGQPVERLKIYCRGECCGEAVLREDGARVEICGQIADPGDGLYRAVLTGDCGELSLGVMEPRDGMLTLRRRPELCEVARVGGGRCIRVGCSFSFGKTRAWIRSDEPANLVHDEFLRQRLARQPYAWWRRREDGISVALPLKTDAPFPLDALFCFARVERVEGEVCVIYAFDECGKPVCGCDG